MPNDADERELYRLLADDADRARLTPPEDLRARGDRRTAVRAALGTLAVVVVVGGVLVGGNGLLGDAAPDPDPVGTPTPSVTPTQEPTEAATPRPTTIPAEAFLGRRDLRNDASPADSSDVPAPCGRALLPGVLTSGGSPERSRTMQGSYLAPDLPAGYVPDGTISQTILLLTDEASADALMGDIEAAVVDCPTETTDDSGEVRYSLADPALPLSSARPDRHLLIEINSPGLDLGDGQPNPARIDTYVSVVQVWDTVTFVTMRGWEASDTDIEDVRRLASAATVRLLDWRNG